jgi:hypothetical protein
MEADVAKRVVEPAKALRAPEDSEQAEHGREPNIAGPAIKPIRPAAFRRLRAATKRRRMVS